MPKYRWHQIPGYLFSNPGKRRIKKSVIYRLGSLIIPLAVMYRRYMLRKVIIIAVIGSHGKTTTTRAIAVALGLPAEMQWASSHYFLASILLGISPWASFRVIEVGIERKGQMAKNAMLVQPDVVVVTGIGSEHITSMGSLDTTREEKAMMVRSLPENGLVVLNGDDQHVLKMREYTSARVVTFGYGKTNGCQASILSADLNRGYVFSIQNGETIRELATKLCGRGAAYSLMAALIIADHLSVDPSMALKHLKELCSTPERLELIKTPTGALLLVDTFKSAIETYDLALDTMAELQADRKIVIAGMVTEPQGIQGVLYRRLGRRIAEVADQLIFLGTNTAKKQLFSGARSSGMPDENLHYARYSIKMAIELALKLLKEGDLVLIKGRQAQKMLRIALALNGQPVDCSKEFCQIEMSCSQCKGYLQ